MKKKIKTQSGFTLVELIVAIGLFALLISVAVGGFVRALKNERQITALLAANTAASFTTEQMAREIRTGVNFTASGSTLTFTNAKGDTVSYCLDAAGHILRAANLPNCTDGDPVTSNAVNVRSLSFVLLGDATYPPRVTLLLRISPKGETGVNSTVLNIQTTISARNF